MAYLDSNFDGTDAILMRNNIFANNTTSNIPSVWGATAKSLEGIEIGMVAPQAYRLHNGGVSQEVDQELSKMGGARASGEQKSSNWVQGQPAKPIN